MISGGIHDCIVFSLQLHFIDNYLLASDPGFVNLYAADQLKMKEALYVEVNR